MLRCSNIITLLHDCSYAAATASGHVTSEWLNSVIFVVNSLVEQHVVSADIEFCTGDQSR